MNLLAAIKREERKVEKRLGKLQHHLERLRGATKALAHSADGRITRFKKRTMSAAARAKISRGARRRWARVRAKAKKAVGD
jgi:hypothetical protein